MTQEKEALKLALEALEREARGYAVHDALQIPRSMRNAIVAIKEVLAQPEQIPPSAYSNTHQPEPPPECPMDSYGDGNVYRGQRSRDSVVKTITLAQPEEPCDMGKMCIGCSPRNSDGSCPDAKPEHEFVRGECVKCGASIERQEPVTHTLNCVCGAVWDIKTDGSEEMVHTPYTTPPQPEPEPCDMKEMCIGCSPRNADGSCPDAPRKPLTDEQKQAMRLYKAVERLALQAGEDTDESVDWLCGEHGGMFKLYEAYFSPKKPDGTCPTCESLSRAVMTDHVFHDKLTKPLTDKQLNVIGSRWHLNLLGADEKAELFAFARAIEAAHGIKE